MDRDLCLVCAWRSDCQKRFKSEGLPKCQDFSRDVSIKTPEAPKPEASDNPPPPPKGLWNI